MGSVSLSIGHGTARFTPNTICSSSLNFLMLVSLLITNIFVLYTLTSSRQRQTLPHSHRNLSLISQHVSLILKQIDSSQKKLDQIEKDLLGHANLDLTRPDIPVELKNFLMHHRLPLGKDSKSGMEHMVSSIAHSCTDSLDLLSQYMKYKINGVCPNDSHIAQKMISKGCEPLPRRRCFTMSVPKQGLLPFPISLWKPVSNKIANWYSFSCKTFECFNSKKIGKNCVGCFDLINGSEKNRWFKIRGKNDFTLDDVLLMGNGGIRVGFDLGGGSGNFAARIAAKNVTVITSLLNDEAPLNEFVAARGLFPLFSSLYSRFPFYDSIFDLIRLNDLGNDRQEKMEFMMFDIDRILRVGGLLWLDNFLCVDEEKKNKFTQIIEKFGYKKLKWVVGEKTDDGEDIGKMRTYLSAVLQKPPRV